MMKCTLFDELIRKINIRAWAVIVLNITAFFSRAQSINIRFTEMRSPNGQVILKVFYDDKSFQDDKPVKVIKFKKVNVVNGQMTVSLNFLPGTFGFALIDDENFSNDMDYNFVGMPKEGFGFSNYYLTGLRKPKFEQFKFEVKKDQNINVAMRIKYL